MFSFPIGVMLESFRLPLDQALACAQKIGARGIQVYAVRGPVTPETMDAQARRDFLAKVKDHGLVISALCGDLGHGFGKAELTPDLIEKS